MLRHIDSKRTFVFAAITLAFFGTLVPIPAVQAAGKGDPAAKKKASAKKKKAPAKQKASYIRVRRDGRKRPIAMDVAIVRFQSAKRPSVVVDLVGVVHVADKVYYEDLNKRFRGYDAVLYELVAPTGVKIPRGGLKNRPRSFLSSMQMGIKNVLNLSFQLQIVDYSRRNFVHADMTPKEFADSMNRKGESFFKMFLRMMSQAMKSQASNKTSDLDLIIALLSPNRSVRLKRIMAEQFEGMESALSAINGPDGSTIITERNKKALSVLREQLKNPKRKRLAIFYGAGHLSDMEMRMVKEFGFKRTGIEWLKAWDLTTKSRKRKAKK